MRRILELYDETEEITNIDINDLFCLFANSKPINFDESVKYERWRQAMEE